jgi:hypothetical protein
MSTYCTIDGALVYPNQEDFDNAKAILEKGGWLNKDSFIVDEINNPITEDKNIDEANRTIFIPYWCHCNLGYVLNAKDGILKGNTGHIVLTCTDGCFVGSVIDGENEKEFDLEEWANEDDSFGPAPDCDTDEGAQEFADWLMDIEQAFFEEYN